MADQAKYQKLAAEYTKLKAQVPVLKQAYQDQVTENGQIKDVIKEKDQSVRKFQQEIDSLTFRNQQLSKRVLVLQDELEVSEHSKKKNKHKSNETSPEHINAQISPTVFNEELQNKIEENARLHKQVYAATEEYKLKIQELQQKLSQFEREASQHAEILNGTVQKNKTLIDKLQGDKAMLEVKIQTQDNDVREFKNRTEHAESNLHTVQRDLRTKLGDATKIIHDKLPFIDTKSRYLNGLNLPTHDRRHQIRARELVSQAVTLQAEFTQSLSNFYTYCEQRSRIYPCDGITEPLSPVNSQYCKYLHENASYIRPLDQSLRMFLDSLRDDSLTTIETATDLQIFSRHFKKLVAYKNKLLPYQLSSIEEECNVSSCTSTLEAKNMELHKSLKRLNSVFNKLDSYIHVIGCQSSNVSVHPQTNHPRLFTALCQAINDLHESIKEVSKHYNSKVSLEHQLPTATTKLKTTDECIVSSLISLVTSSGKIATFMSGNQEFFTQSAGYRTRGSSIGTDVLEGPKSNPAVVQFRQQAVQYILSLNRPCPESVPHKIAVQNRKTILSSAESKEGLAKQIATFQQKVNKLEQEKEHWMLELQLLQIKFDNEVQKVKKLEKEAENQNISDSISYQTEVMANSIMESRHKTSSITSDDVEPVKLGSLENSALANSDIETREKLIKNHFTNRINDITLHLQLADSKSVNFHAEVRALHKQLLITQNSRTLAEEELKSTNQVLAQLKDELQTTTRSYEGQLSMMSDHLAGMNEKLAQQKDEIDDLKGKLVVASKGQKKSKK